MRANPPKSLAKILSGPEQGLAALISRARRLQALDRELRLTLEKRLAGHCQLANIRDKQAIFHADTAAWATRLRMCTPQLLASLKNKNLDIKDIVIKVRPSVPLSVPQQKQSLVVDQAKAAASAPSESTK